jgi:hypothetical protein
MHEDSNVSAVFSAKCNSLKFSGLYLYDLCLGALLKLRDPEQDFYNDRVRRKAIEEFFLEAFDRVGLSYHPEEFLFFNRIIDERLKILEAKIARSLLPADADFQVRMKRFPKNQLYKLASFYDNLVENLEDIHSDDIYDKDDDIQYYDLFDHIDDIDDIVFKSEDNDFLKDEFSEFKKKMAKGLPYRE